MTSFKLIGFNPTRRENEKETITSALAEQIEKK